MPTSLKSLYSSSAPGLIGSYRYFPDSTLVNGKPILQLGSATYLRHGYILSGEQANYPEAFAGFAKYNSINISNPTLKLTQNPYVANGTYANGVILFPVTNQNQVYRSADNGNTWTLITFAANGFSPSSYHRIAYGKGLWIMTSNGSGYYMYSTDDGLTWSSKAVPSIGGYTSARDIAYGNGIWVMSGNNSGTDKVVYSSDGMTWTQSGSGGGISAGYVDFAAGLFVMTSYGTQTQFAISTDGANWVQKVSPVSLFVNSNSAKLFTTAFNGAVCIFYGSQSNTWGLIYSTDAGATWTSITGNNTAYQPLGVAVIPGWIVVFSSSPNYGQTVHYSKDGITWQMYTGGYSIYGVVSNGAAVIGNGNISSNYQMAFYNGLQFGVGSVEVGPVGTTGQGLTRYMRIK